MRLRREEACQVLGVSEGETAEKIKKIYRKKCLQEHPDKNLNDPKAKEKFQRLNEAYRCLTDANYSTEDDLTEEELRAEMAAMFDEMYEEFKAMCRATGIPFPDPETAKKLFFSGNDDVSNLFGQDDDIHNIFEAVLATDDQDLATRLPFGLSPDLNEADLAKMLDDMSVADADAMLRVLQAGDDLFAEPPPPVPSFASRKKQHRPFKTTTTTKGHQNTGSFKSTSKAYLRRNPQPSGRPATSENYYDDSSEEENNKELQVAQRVELRSSGLSGVIKFIGEVHYARGEFIGVALDEPFGKNDGTVKGVSYFSCPAKHGIFVRRNDISI